MILALDLGSTHLKARVYDPALRTLGEAHHPMRYLTPSGPGSVEFDAAAFSGSLSDCVRDALASAGIEGGAVRRIGITSQAQTLALVDGNGRPLTTFVSWMDTRCSGVCRAMAGSAPWTEVGVHASFSELIPGLAVCLLADLRKRTGLPSTGAFGVRLLPGHACALLTGEAWVDENLAAMSGFYSLVRRRWWSEALNAVGVREAQLPALCPIGAAGARTSAAAGRYGLPAGIPVVLAGNDQTAGAYGADLHGAGALLVTLGTAHVAYACCDTLPEPAPGLVRGPYPGGRCYRMGADGRGGNVVDWAVRRLFGDVNRDAFFEAAARAPAGSRGVRFLANADGTGEWDGPPAPDPADQARSVLECLARTVADMIRVVMPVEPETVLLAGGGSRQPLWAEVLSQTTGLRVNVTPRDALDGAARMALDCPVS